MAGLDRRTTRTFRSTFRLAVPLLIAWGVGIAIMGGVAAQTQERAGAMLMDPAFVVGARWYTGLISNLGILAWTIAVAAAFAGAWLCNLGGRWSARKFLMAGAGVGMLLLVDDLLQFHAVLLPGELGLPKALGQALIGMSLIAWVGMFVSEIRRTHVHLLVAAGMALGASFVVDSLVGPAPGEGWSVVEDGAKFLGVLAWAAYFVVTTRDISRSVFTDALLADPSDLFGEVPDWLDDLGPTDDADTTTDAVITADADALANAAPVA